MEDKRVIRAIEVGDSSNIMLINIYINRRLGMISRLSSMNMKRTKLNVLLNLNSLQENPKIILISESS